MQCTTDKLWFKSLCVGTSKYHERRRTLIYLTDVRTLLNHVTDTRFELPYGRSHQVLTDSKAVKYDKGAPSFLLFQRNTYWIESFWSMKKMDARRTFLNQFTLTPRVAVQKILSNIFVACDFQLISPISIYNVICSKEWERGMPYIWFKTLCSRRHLVNAT